MSEEMIQKLVNFIMGHGTDVRIHTYMEGGQALATVVLTLHGLGGARAYTTTGVSHDIEKLIRTAFELVKTANEDLRDITLPIKLEVLL